MAEEQFCYLTTRGRRTGNPHEIEIWYAERDGRLYMLAGGRERSDWVRNLMADPAVQVRIAGTTRPMRARVVEDPAQDRLARELLDGKYYGWASGKQLTEWARTALAVVLE